MSGRSEKTGTNIIAIQKSGLANTF